MIFPASAQRLHAPLESGVHNPARLQDWKDRGASLLKACQRPRQFVLVYPFACRGADGSPSQTPTQRDSLGCLFIHTSMEAT
jgi:hypothetical protein